VRCFEDPNVIHVAGRVDPLSDIAVIDTELALADMGTGEKALHRFQKQARAGDKEAIKMVAILEPLMKHLDQGKPVRSMGLDRDQQALIRQLCFITAKPVLYVANVIEGGFENNPLLDKVLAHAREERAPVVAICAKIEAEIADLSDEDKSVFLEDIGMHEPGLNRLIRSAYTLLGLDTYFTAGVQEVRAWTIHHGSTAPQAAGVIHTDFERGFIRAEVIAFNDFVSLGGEAKAKEAGKMRLEGKEYLVKDGDVMHFRFNV
jgi:GTP-binding protein YchF